MEKISQLARRFSIKIPGPNSPQFEAELFARHMKKDGKQYIDNKYKFHKDKKWFLFVHVRRGENEWNYEVQFVSDSFIEDMKQLFNAGVEEDVRNYLNNKYGQYVKII